MNNIKLDDNKVVLGLSGGVDSATAALLLKEKGYDVTAVYIRFSEQNIDDDDAKELADKLGIPFIIKDVQKEFKHSVIDYFIKSYREGKTPSPCIVCNRQVKFKTLLEIANETGSRYIATGHYSAKTSIGSKTMISESENKTKDQSYMLCLLTEEQRERVLFPLNSFKNKNDIRKIAQDASISVYNKSDSQEICFIPDGMNYIDFLKANGEIFSNGDYIDQNGIVLGEHSGYEGYTIGQRKGLNIALGERKFVTKINPLDNTVTLGNDDDLFKKKVRITNVNSEIKTNFQELIEYKDKEIVAKVRHSLRKYPVNLITAEKDSAVIEFKKGVRAPTPGQFLVLYDNEIVIGCGEIDNDE